MRWKSVSRLVPALGALLLLLGMPASSPAQQGDKEAADVTSEQPRSILQLFDNRSFLGVKDANKGKGCEAPSVSVLNDITGSVFRTPFQPDPTRPGTGGIDFNGGGQPTDSFSVIDKGNPPVPAGPASSPFIIIGNFP